jgi:uncharacterized membrane protein YbhN (UPF0104 family)
MTSEVIERLKELDIEEFIWIIYLGIIFLSFLSNTLERNYFESGEEEDKEKYRGIMIVIFSILIIVYFYFFQDSLKTVLKLDSSITDKKKNLNLLACVASFLILISGIIYLYIAFKDEDLDVELAFN